VNKHVYDIDTDEAEYQDFSSDESFVSSEDTILVFHMWRYHGCHGYFSLSQWNLKKLYALLL